MFRFSVKLKWDVYAYLPSSSLQALQQQTHSGLCCCSSSCSARCSREQSLSGWSVTHDNHMLVHRTNIMDKQQQQQQRADHLVGYECGDPVVPSVGVDEDVLLPPQCPGSGPGCDGLLEGLIQKPGPWGHTDRLDGWLSSFTVDIYLEWTCLERSSNETQVTVIICM